MGLGHLAQQCMGHEPLIQQSPSRGVIIIPILSHARLHSLVPNPLVKQSAIYCPRTHMLNLDEPSVKLFFDEESFYFHMLGSTMLHWIVCYVDC